MAFPRDKRAYLDYNATAPLRPEARASTMAAMDVTGNPSSIHGEGRAARAIVEHARREVAEFVAVSSRGIVFTSGGTEAGNFALRPHHAGAAPIERLILSAGEHVCMLQGHRFAPDATQIAPLDPRGRLDLDVLEAMLAGAPVMLALQGANNETGVVQPVEEIGKIAAQTGVFFHIDAVQGAGKVPIDVKRIGCHILTISGHKMHAPKGIGAMYVRKGTPVDPMMVGGSHERRRRAGTEAVPSIVALGKAAELAMHSLETGAMHRLAQLRDRLENGILEAIPGTGVNGEGAPRAANTSNIWFDNLEGEALVIALDLKGLAVSGGSACHSGATEPSHVLMAMGLDKNRARASLRFSLLKTATEADIDYALEVVPAAVGRLRELAPELAGTAG